MPIYAYRCEACGFAKDHLQKMSDTLLVICPACGQDTYRKQLTAASFQLKGQGWYATDFKDLGKSAPSSEPKPSDPKPSEPCQCCSGVEACANN